MGLDEFLIPQDPRPTAVPRPLGDLDEVLLAPPIDLDAPEEPSASAVAAALKMETALIEPPPPGGGRGAWPPNHASEPESASAMAGVIIAAPSTDEERVGTARPAGSESVQADEPKTREARTSPTAFESSKRGWDFLATTWDSAPVLTSKDAERIDDGFVSAPPLTQVDWGAIAPAKSISTIPGFRPDVSTSRSTAPLDRWENGFLAPSDFGKTLDDPVDDPGFENDHDGLEERLSRVVDRLERTVERFAPPSPSLGARPRPFRGRIDG